ncbi:glutamate-rich protein 2 [Pteronotus mesoamericanus]|uniref:glutamate-rich protein 2 n=1 Tax=Pteronotus mesoamericanus TaxID=1884717 RepID=UPI0023EA8F02|nr:glutamate-rich protein 2 [Pteronotus parnellii mesoamericanus]
MISVRRPRAGKRSRGDCGSPSPNPRVQPDSSSTSDHPGPAPEPANFSGPPGLGCGASRLPRLRARRFGPKFCIPEISRNYLDKTDAVEAPKCTQNGKLLVCDPKEKVMIEPNETMSEKEVSKNVENKVSLKNTENRVSSKSIENKDTETNLQSKLWSSSFLKESTGEVGKDEVIAKHEKNNEYCFQDIDKLSESTDDDDSEDDTDDEDNEDSSPNIDTHAPLELMAEFLRAEMNKDYHLAKKLCQMILIYEPENPEAKEFFSLIEEMLQMERAQNLGEDDKDSEEDSSSESEGESSEELSEESSDECEDG